MARRIFTGVLIFLSSLFLILSVLGIGLAWVYNEPLTREAVTRLQAIDWELVQAQTAIRNARGELQRTLRIVEGAEKTLASLKDQTEEAKKLFDQFNTTLDKNVIPGLQTTRSGINQVRATLVNLRNTLKNVNSIPLLNLNLPGDEVLANLIEGVDSLNDQISDLQDLARRASVFTSDTSFLLGGDMTETKQHIHELLDSLIEYDRKVTSWHVQARDIIQSLPRWIDRASIIATVFLVWFALSQFGLLLHGLSLQRGGDPLAVIHRQPTPETLAG